MEAAESGLGYKGDGLVGHEDLVGRNRNGITFSVQRWRLSLRSVMNIS